MLICPRCGRLGKVVEVRAPELAVEAVVEWSDASGFKWRDAPMLDAVLFDGQYGCGYCGIESDAIREHVERVHRAFHPAA